MKWTAEGRESELYRGHRVEYVTCPEDGMVCQVWTPSNGDTSKRAANARLIAAAPTMEKALRSVIESLSTTIGSGTIDKEDIAAAVSAARAALANL